MCVCVCVCGCVRAPLSLGVECFHCIHFHFIYPFSCRTHTENNNNNGYRTSRQTREVEHYSVEMKMSEKNKRKLLKGERHVENGNYTHMDSNKKNTREKL